MALASHVRDQLVRVAWVCGCTTPYHMVDIISNERQAVNGYLSTPMCSPPSRSCPSAGLAKVVEGVLECASPLRIHPRRAKLVMLVVLLLLILNLVVICVTVSHFQK